MNIATATNKMYANPIAPSALLRGVSIAAAGIKCESIKVMVEIKVGEESDSYVQGPSMSGFVA